MLWLFRWFGLHYFVSFGYSAFKFLLDLPLFFPLPCIHSHSTSLYQYLLPPTHIPPRQRLVYTLLCACQQSDLTCTRALTRILPINTSLPLTHPLLLFLFPYIPPFPLSFFPSFLPFLLPLPFHTSLTSYLPHLFPFMPPLPLSFPSYLPSLFSFFLPFLFPFISSFVTSILCRWLRCLSCRLRGARSCSLVGGGDSLGK